MALPCLQDDVVVSFDSVVDLSAFTIRIAQKDVEKLPEILLAISAERRQEMRQAMARVWQRWGGVAWVGLDVVGWAGLGWTRLDGGALESMIVQCAGHGMGRVAGIGGLQHPFGMCGQ